MFGSRGRHDNCSLHTNYGIAANIFQRNPFKVHTNLLNGLGIIAGYTCDTCRFDGNGVELQADVLGIGAGELEPCQ